MKPYSFLITLSLLVIVNIISAQQVDIKTAEQVALHFYYEQYNSFQGTINTNDILIKESFTETQDGEEVLYIFNISSGGFVIIPTEKAIEPILGYSFDGAYTPDKTNSNFSAWLQLYKNKVSYLKENQIKPDKVLSSKWEELLQKTYNNKDKQKDVDPLGTANWSGDFPYNIHCPEDPQAPYGYCPIGPVGVAMGQIMYYWRYPLTGNDSITYYSYQNDTISINFGEIDYEWTGMADYIDYYNPSPTALLLYHCAASVQTSFGSTGANSQEVPFALTNYFKYDTSCEFLLRQGIAVATWKQMLKDELDNLRPIYYSGANPPPYNDHVFVIDGYHEGDDMYHFNFGWGGYMNGWYTITDAGGFTENQAMVRNIFPGSGYPYYCQDSDTVTSFSRTIDDGSGSTYNYQDNSNCNWLIAPQSETDSISGLILNFSSFNTEAGNDIVTIYDGPTNAYPLLGSFSGTELPPQITTSGNTVLINFSTNGTITEPGWLLNFESIFPIFCNTLQTYTSITDTISDGSGQFYYQNSTNCMWLLEPPGANELTFYFTSFVTEEGKDILKFYDASNNQLLAEYSGIYLPGNPPPPVTSPSGEMFITFQSDIIYNAPGWEGIYVIESGGIEGNVYNIFTNIPVPGAIVSLGDYADTTNAFGNFSIDDIPVGSYEIEVTADNYYPLPPGMVIEIIEGIVTTANIPLDPLYLNPPLNLQFDVLNPGEGVKLFWNQPLPYPWLLEGYDVYLREWGVGDFEIINDELVTDTLFIDSEAGGCSNNEYYITAVYNAGESQGSNIVYVIIPGLTQIFESNVEIYPNPAKDMIYIVLPTRLNQEIYSVDLYDNKGRIIHTGTIKTEGNVPQKLKINKLEKGIYLINIQGSALNFSRKIIVQ